MKEKENREFEINEYRYHLVGSNLTCVVWARKQETADKIIAISNTDTIPDLIWIPKRIGFCKKIRTDIPPYELEQEQIESAEKKLKYRREHSKEKQK